VCPSKTHRAHLSLKGNAQQQPSRHPRPSERRTLQVGVLLDLLTRTSSCLISSITHAPTLTIPMATSYFVCLQQSARWHVSHTIPRNRVGSMYEKLRTGRSIITPHATSIWQKKKAPTCGVRVGIGYGRFLFLHSLYCHPFLLLRSCAALDFLLRMSLNGGLC